MRTKKTQKKKSTRTKNKTNALYRPFGGCLFNPPKKCFYRRKAEDGGTWTDIGCCQACRDRCDRYMYYIKLKPKEKRKHLMKQGVKEQNY